MLYDSTYMGYLEQSNSEVENGMAFVEAEGGWDGELLFNGYTVWVGREVLDKDRRDACTAM